MDPGLLSGQSSPLGSTTQLSQWSLPFEEVGLADVPIVGGKAANLGEMVRAGLPVPPGFCVTAAAYRGFIAESDSHARIGLLLDGLDTADTAAIENATSEIRRMLTEQALPADIGAEIVARYKALAIKLGGSGGPAPLVAVRSSATAEDLPDASFAGQQDTYLNVSGDQSLLEHVKRCWASLWTTRAVTYRQKQGYDHGQVALAVVVQAMVPADVAGVLFTADPLTSDRQVMVVNASWGLGEAIVAGLVTPDTWSIRKGTLQVISRQIGQKEVQVTRAANGQTVEGPVPPALRDRASLTDHQLAELSALGAQVEAHYQAPMDIEWALTNGRFYMLQARPITTLSAQVAYPAGDYNRTMFLEIFPDPLSPAFTSVIEPLFAGMLDFTFRSLGFRPPAEVPAVRVFHNQPYFNQRYIEAAFAPLRPSTRQVFVSRFVNPFGHHGRGAPFELSLPFLRMAWRLLKLMRSLHVLLPREVGRYRETIAELHELDLASLDDAQLLERVERLVFTASSRLLNYDFLLIALVGVTYQALGRLLGPYFGHESEDIQARLVSGVTGNVTMETNIRLWDLSMLARRSSVVRRELEHGDDGDLRERLAQTDDGRDFLRELDRFLAEYGHREVRMDILYPTWSEDPAPVLFFIRGYLDVDQSASPHRQQERLIAEREELAERVRLRLRRDVRGRLLWPIFAWVLRHTQANTRQRDTMHFELTRLFPPFRRFLLELGRRWTERDLIERPEDVFFLTLGEMKALIEKDGSMADEVAQRQAELESNRKRMPPPIIRDGRELWSEEPAVDASDDGLRGVAGSPGLVRGVVRVVRDPDEFGKLGRGEILVAPLTNPVWTPLFAIAGGLITEVGGILSHGAIVAREYGIPAVMAVPGATARLADGQLVEVDGSSGTVRLLASEATFGAPEPAREQA
jgi:rifampicin phosphotransferase